VSMTTRRSVLKILAGSGFALVASSASQREALAQAPTNSPEMVGAEIMIMHATNEGKGIDPGIGDLPELKKPPFSSYDTYKLLEKPKLTLKKAKEQELKLPNDSKLFLTFKDVVPAKGRDPEKFAVGTRIRKPKDETDFIAIVVNSPKGKFYFVAGPKHGKGILVLGIKIVDAPKGR
jgi:hypothetical protein